MGYIRELVRGTISTDWAAISLTPAIRLGVTTVTMLGIVLLLDRPDFCLGLGAGMVFTAVADPGGSYRHRLYALLMGSALMTVAVFLGGLVAALPVPHLVVIAAWALVAGFLCCTGPRGAMLGVLSLVLLVVFSGIPGYRHDLVTNTAACALGCAAMAVAICSPWVLRRAGGLRGQLALFYRGVASSIAASPDAIRSPMHAERLRAAALDFDFDVDASGGPFALWFAELLDESSRVRLSLVALSAHLQHAPPTAALTAYLDAARELSRSIGLTLVWRLRRRRLVEALEQFDQAEARCVADDPDLVALLGTTSEPLRHVATRVSGPWPVGRGSGIRLPAPRRPAPPNLRSHLTWSDQFLRHGVRLAIAMSLAVAIDLVAPFSHASWVAVTVAWIAKPGYGDTTMKVVSRTTGTIAGIAVAVGLDLVLPMREWDMLAVIGISAALVIAFIVPNYAICIANLTLFVFFLTSLQVNSILSESVYRLLGTLLAGLIVLAVAQLWPVSLRRSVCASLAAFAAAIEAYGTALLSEDAFDNALLPDLRADLLGARTAATAAVASAAHEPGRHLLHVDDASRISNVLDQLSADLWEWETLQQATEWRSTSGELTRDLERIIRQLRELEATGRVQPAPTSEVEPRIGPALDDITQVTMILDGYA